MGMMVFESGYRAVRASTTSRAASASPLRCDVPVASRPHSGGALGCLRARLLGGVSGIALPAAALALGVSLATEASAQTTFTGTYHSTIQLSNYASGNPFTFAPGATVNTAAGDAVDGDTTKPWTLTNNGMVTGANNGIYLRSLSTVTNAGSITGGFEGVFLNAGGSVTNQAGGVISGGGGGVFIGAAGT